MDSSSRSSSSSINTIQRQPSGMNSDRNRKENEEHEDEHEDEHEEDQEYFDIELTSDAIQDIVHDAINDNNEVVELDSAKGNKAVGPFVVRICNFQDKITLKSLSDGTRCCAGTIVNMKDNHHLPECIISISAFVVQFLTSSAYDNTSFISLATSSTSSDRDGDDMDDDNDEFGDDKNNKDAKKKMKKTHLAVKTANQYFPFIYVTQYEILYKKRSGTNCNDEETENQKSEIKQYITTEEFRLPVGRIASLLSSRKLTIEAFHQQSMQSTEMEENVTEITNFIEQHSAIMALQSKKEKVSLLSSSSFSLMMGSLKYFQNYTSALNEFDQMQREKQFMSLSDLTEESSYADRYDDVETITSDACCNEHQSWIQNKETLEYALLCKDEPLSSELLLRWHAWLMGDGLQKEAGSFRSEKSIHCPSDQVPERMETFCNSLEQHWLPQIKEKPNNIASFAAAAILGILDIAPFEAGNQWLARILLNWTLRRIGLPFCITLYSNLDEKSRFYSVIELARQNLCLVPQGCINESEIAVILQSTGGLDPLAGFLLDRIACSTTDLGVLVEKKAVLAAEETDARLVRLARENAAESVCLICLDENPNISTLCCGKPIHFNCLAEWLSSHSSCPQCRSALPSLSSSRESRIANDGNDDTSTGNLGIFNESLFHSLHSSSSSSSEDSSSSSSESSVGSSVFLYSGLDYDVHDSTSEEEDDGRRNTRNSSHVNYVPSDEEDMHIYVSENDDDNSNSIRNYQSSESDDIGSSDSDETTEDQYALLCEDERNNNENYPSRDNESPRMSFLDPDLLNDVQNRRESTAIVESTSFNEENSSVVDDDEIFLPAFARPHHFLFDDDISRVE
jgi:hypothetical protein